MNYNFLNVLNFGHDVLEKGSIFKDITVPNGLDLEKIEDTIVTECWDLQPIEGDWELLKKMIDNWFSIKKDDFERLYQALSESYNPIHNYDRFEDRKEKRNLKVDGTVTSTSDDSSEDLTSAYNSSSYSPSGKNVYKGNDKDITNRSDTEDFTTENHLYGNIGVTTSQQMIESEIKLRRENNIYKIIAIDFRNEFMLSLL